MRSTVFRFPTLVALTLAMPLAWAAGAAAQRQTSPAAAKPAAKAAAISRSWTVPRLPDGHPDLQGVWTNNSVTPLERPKQWAGKKELTDDELAELKTLAA
ncbi:MAG: hypothetical protein HY047_00315, partial [Acidobacteria bacterium]|nr:hypothetical protein [Acidobacteriota bacterium]